MTENKIDHDAILRGHTARLAEANTVLQQSAATLANANRAIADTRRLMARRKSKLDLESLTSHEALLREMRDRLARCRSLRDTQTDRRATLLAAVIRIKLRDGALPWDGAPADGGHPGNGTECAVCGSTVKYSQQGMTVSVEQPARPVEFHTECFALSDSERRHASRDHGSFSGS